MKYETRKQKFIILHFLKCHHYFLLPEVLDRNWETFLYAPIYDFGTVACLLSYS